MGPVREEAEGYTDLDPPGQADSGGLGSEREAFERSGIWLFIGSIPYWINDLVWIDRLAVFPLSAPKATNSSIQKVQHNVLSLALILVVVPKGPSFRFLIHVG